MTKTTHICDRCGGAILEDRTLLRVECGVILARRKAIDLCSHCSPLLEAWLAGVPEELNNPVGDRLTEALGS